MSPGARLDDPVAWHDLECATYASDLPLWRELAAARAGRVLDLGCGTGRVALDLAARGHRVVAVDSAPELVEALQARARAAGLAIEAHVLDVRSLGLPGRSFALAIAPMQVAQLLGGEDGRAALLERVRALLQPGGLLALALADPWEGVPDGRIDPPLPDMREQDGWVLSSTPVAVRSEGDAAVAIDRLREAVSPDGEHLEAVSTIALERTGAQALEAQGLEHGYRVAPARPVPATPGYVGSTVVMLEAA